MSTHESISMLRCPDCHHDLASAPMAVGQNLSCRGCGRIFESQHGILDMLEAGLSTPSTAQRLMESSMVARVYESRLWRRNPLFGLATGLAFRAEQQMIGRALGDGAAPRILDLACGPAIYSRPIAEAHPEGWVVGLDLSRAMLEHASRVATTAGLRNLFLVHGTALDLPFQDGSFDGALCCGALHLFPDVPRVLCEVRRVIRPGGRLVLAVFRRGESALSRLGDRVRRRLYGVASFSPEELTTLLHEARFPDVEIHHSRRLWLVVSGQ